MAALRRFVPQADLAGFDNAFTKALGDVPTTEAFLLIAKAKSQGARDLVGRLRELPAWQNVEAVKIAHAALGSKDDEGEFLLALESARDGEALARAIRPLALVGTARSLKAIAELLRTPLTLEMPGHGPGRSDEPLLYVPGEPGRSNFLRALPAFVQPRLEGGWKATSPVSAIMIGLAGPAILA